MKLLHELRTTREKLWEVAALARVQKGNIDESKDTTVIETYDVITRISNWLHCH